MADILQQYDVANGVNLLLFSALGRLRYLQSPEFPNGRLQPYAGVGLGPTILYTASSVDGATRSGYELGNVGFQAIAGLQYTPSRRFDIFTEVKLTRTEANGSIAGGSSKTTVETEHLVVGAGYHF